MNVWTFSGAMQNFARRYKIPIDHLGFEFEVMDEEHDMNSKPVSEYGSLSCEWRLHLTFTSFTLCYKPNFFKFYHKLPFDTCWSMYLFICLQEDGVYVKGLFMEGARWDRANKVWFLLISVFVGLVCYHKQLSRFVITLFLLSRVIFPIDFVIYRIAVCRTTYFMSSLHCSTFQQIWNTLYLSRFLKYSLSWQQNFVLIWVVNRDLFSDSTLTCLYYKLPGQLVNEALFSCHFNQLNLVFPAVVL